MQQFCHTLESGSKVTSWAKVPAAAELKRVVFFLFWFLHVPQSSEHKGFFWRMY